MVRITAKTNPSATTSNTAVKIGFIPLASLYQTAKSHESKGKDSGRCHYDRYTLERLGNAGIVLDLGSHSGEDDHGEKETDAGAEGVNECLRIVVSQVDVVDADTEYSAVGGDKRKIYTQSFV